MDRTALDYKPQLTGALMGIDRSTADENSSLTIEQANIKINHLGGAKERPKVTSCRCVTDCSKNTSCSCRGQKSLVHQNAMVEEEATFIASYAPQTNVAGLQ
jgi:hypothetical protein